MTATEHGAVASEYALLAGLVAVVIALTVLAVGGRVSDLYVSFLTAMGWN